MEISYTLGKHHDKDNLEQYWKEIKWHHLVEHVRLNSLGMPQEWKASMAAIKAYKTMS